MKFKWRQVLIWPTLQLTDFEQSALLFEESQFQSHVAPLGRIMA